MFAHATKAASAFEFFSCCAYGVRSAAPNGDRIFDDRVALAAEDRLDGGDVARPEGRVLGEDDDFLPVDFGGKMFARVDDVLQRLPAGAERVPVEAGDRVGRGAGRM